MNQEERDRIIRILEERGAILACSRCGRRGFTLLDGYFNQSFQAQLNSSIIIGGPTIPSVAVICNNCGFISHHAIGALGLLPEQNTQNGTQTPPATA